MLLFSNLLFAEEWFIWALGLTLVLPIIVLTLNEIAYFLRKTDRSLVKPINTVKNIVLPLLALTLLLTKVIRIEEDTIAFKLLETTIWILLINAGLTFFNAIFFKDAKKNTWRAKVPQLFLDIFRVIMVTVGIAIVLSAVWEADLGKFATAIGLGSFVLGLALQDTLGNLFSGIAMVYEKPFSEGDWIQVGEKFGKVIEINWRSVRLETKENEMVIIPHLIIGQGLIINYSLPEKIHVVKQEIQFSNIHPPNVVKEALLGACISTPEVLKDPAPKIQTINYGDNRITYEIEFAVSDFAEHGDILDVIMTRLWYTFKRYDLQTPHQQIIIQKEADLPKPREERATALQETIDQLPNLLPIQKANAKELEDGSQIEHYGKGEIIIHQGDLTGSLYILLEGKAAISIQATDNQFIETSRLQKGDFFGEVALLGSKKSSVQVTALSDLKLMVIFPQEVLEMVEKNPRLAHQLEEVMDARKKTTNKLSQGFAIEQV